MLEQRISNLEKSVVQMDAKLSAIELVLAEIKGQLSQFPKAMDFAALKADVAEIKGRLTGIEGRLSQSPTWLQLLVALIATWGAGAAIVAALIRFAVK